MIFVTGGTGLAGRHILMELRDRGLAARALVRDAASAIVVRELGAEPFTGTVEDAATWRRVGECSAIIHAAALITSRSPWQHYHRVNVEAVRLAAERAGALGIPLVHLSSVAVYGRDRFAEPVAPVDESFPFGPLDDPAFYPRSKRLAEEALWTAVRAGLRAIALRPGVIYGEGDRQFLPRIVRMARRGWLPLMGAGDQPLGLVHARSVAQAAVLALNSVTEWGRAFNVTNDDCITPRDFIQAVAEGLGQPVRVLRLPLSLTVMGARLADGVLGTVAPNRFPAKVSGAIRFWRGGNPYTSEAAIRRLHWSPGVRHREAVTRAVRALLAGEKNQKAPDQGPGPSR
jgi:nucleoside-diphosphate-sugar epimerase